MSTEKILANMLGRGEEFHEKSEKLARKLHGDHCSCDRCRMKNDKYSKNQYVNVAGTPVSLDRP